MAVVLALVIFTFKLKPIFVSHMLLPILELLTVHNNVKRTLFNCNINQKEAQCSVVCANGSTTICRYNCELTDII